MFTSVFLIPVWTWVCLFAAAVLIPILIHLINLFRYRKVKWAAMDFLLKGHRKKQKRIWLTQLLLIVNRIALLVLAIILFGQVQCNRDPGRTLNEGMVHLCIIDDSASMGQLQVIQSDQDDPDSERKRLSCLDRARLSVLSLAEELSTQPGQQILVIRTSNSKLASLEPVPCDSNIGKYVQDVFESPVSDLGKSPWQWFEENLDRLPTANRLYLFSDFRTVDMENDNDNSIPNSLKEKFQSVSFIRCVEPVATNNLSVVNLAPEHRLVASSVPFYLKLRVRNHSQEPKRNVKLNIRKSSNAAGNELTFNEFAAVLIPELQERKTAEVQVPVLVHDAGAILFEAEISDDELLADNTFHQVVNVQSTNRILLITDSSTQSARYLKWLFEPKFQESTIVNSGFQTEIRNSSEISKESFLLKSYPIIFLLSDDLTNSQLVEKLEKYVQEGGSLVVVPGEFADVEQVNRSLFKNGKGLIPFRLEAAVELPDRPGKLDTDIEFTDPKIGQLFEGDSRELLGMVQFYRKFVPPRNLSWTDWKLPGSPINVVATIRGRATTPLIVRSTNGRGNVIVFLSPFDDRWNNWANNPTFLVLIYQLIYQTAEFRPTNHIQPGKLCHLS